MQKKVVTGTSSDGSLAKHFERERPRKDIRQHFTHCRGGATTILGRSRRNSEPPFVRAQRTYLACVNYEGASSCLPLAASISITVSRRLARPTARDHAAALSRGCADCVHPFAERPAVQRGTCEFLRPAKGVHSADTLSPSSSPPSSFTPMRAWACAGARE